MRIRVLDQVHISSIKPDSLRPGEEFDIDESSGAELMARLPGALERSDGEAATQKKALGAAPANKARGKKASA